MPEQTRAPVFIDGLYGKLVEGRNQLLFPSATLQVIEADLEPVACAMTDLADNYRSIGSTMKRSIATLL